MFEIETGLRAQGCRRIAGIDEAGRGPLAGPVVSACCILPEGLILDGINDSKQLSEEERERFFAILISTPGIEFGIGQAEAPEIDRVNILKATFHSMYRALIELQEKPDYILVDGSLTPSFGIPTRALVKGDSRSACIAAASILAKVTRDRIMVEMDKIYPQYGFAIHKGYGTPEHLAALKQYGPCAIHRKSFEPVRIYYQTDDQLDLLN